jgi:hypothetical protein
MPWRRTATSMAVTQVNPMTDVHDMTSRPAAYRVCTFAVVGARGQR